MFGIPVFKRNVVLFAGDCFRKGRSPEYSTVRCELRLADDGSLAVAYNMSFELRVLCPC